MSDPRRPAQFGPPPPDSERTEPLDLWNPPYADPAYADQITYAPSHLAAPPPWTPNPPGPHPTYQLPQGWQQNAPTTGGTPPAELTNRSGPAQGPRTPRWLWVASVAAVVLVVALAISWVIVNDPAQEQAAFEPLPPMPSPTSTVPAPTRTPGALPTLPPLLPPLIPTAPRNVPPSLPPSAVPPGGPTPGPSGTQTVVYHVAGEGRAISLVYMDTGDILQTEFNVALPWSKQVSLSKDAIRPPGITIINIGHNVTCSVTVAGVQVSERTGNGLTVCRGLIN